MRDSRSQRHLTNKRAVFESPPQHHKQKDSEAAHLPYLWVRAFFFFFIIIIGWSRNNNQGEEKMKSYMRVLSTLFLVYAVSFGRQNHIPVPHQKPHPSDHICWGYAMGMAGNSICDPMTLIPNSNGIDLSYFDQRDWGQVDSILPSDILYWPGTHAAYVQSVSYYDQYGHVITDSIHVQHTATAWNQVYTESLLAAKQRVGVGNPSYFCRRKKISLTVQNDFAGGTVTVDGTQFSSGSVTAAWWYQIPLLASNQDYQSVYRAWQKWGAGTFQNPMYIYAASGDAYTASFTKWCDMTFSNSLPGISGGTISVWDTVRSAQFTVRIPYGTTFHAIAIDQDSSSISYIFSRWTDGSSIPRDRSITPSQHGSYIAQFTTKPFAPAGLEQLASIGQNVHLWWTDNPNASRVTKYHIYRAAPSIPEQKHIVDSVSSGVHSWYDFDVIVKGPRDGPEYVYYVCGVDNQTGTEGYEATVNQFGQPVTAHPGAQLAAEEGSNGVMTEFSVGNYPNPFNPSTTIAFSLVTNSTVKLDIYDVMGRKVRSLVDGNKSAGYYSVVWNGKDESGRQIASGMYLYRFTASPVTGEKAFTQSGKLVLTK